MFMNMAVSQSPWRRSKNSSDTKLLTLPCIPFKAFCSIYPHPLRPTPYSTPLQRRLHRYHYISRAQCQQPIYRWKEWKFACCPLVLKLVKRFAYSRVKNEGIWFVTYHCNEYQDDNSYDTPCDPNGDICSLHFRKMGGLRGSVGAYCAHSVDLRIIEKSQR